MKLTKYQKKIIDRIISGEVYDIPSFLRVFDKGREKQYNIAEIKSFFSDCENGVTYMFRKQDGNTYFTDLYDSTGNVYETLPVKNKTTVELHSNPISVPVKAELAPKIIPEIVEIDGKSFGFDYLNNKYLVADSFSEIRDFVALWSYLRRETLIFEGNKPINEEDISIFFELTNQSIKAQINPLWIQKVEMVSGTENDEIPKLNINMIPQKDADGYINQAWKFNKNEYEMYKDYVGVKILPTSELKNYQQSKYKTVEQKAQNRSLLVAWIAVLVSVISILVGTIIPMFKPSEMDFLSEISEQLYSIEQKLNYIDDNNTVYLELQKIEDTLSQMKNNINDTWSQEIKSLIEALIERLDEKKLNM